MFRVSGIPFLVSEKGDIIFARPYRGIQGVRWAAGHMGPALHGIFVGQGTRTLLGVRYGIGGRTESSAPTEMSEHLRRAACPHAAVMVRWLTGGGLRAARPTEAYFAVRRGGALPLPRATARVAPTEGSKQYRGRADVGSESSTAGGGCSEAISRKCPDWRPKQWPEIGWHDGGQENPAPTEAYFAVRRGGALPLPQATARVAPTECNKKCGGAGQCVHRPLRGRCKACGADKGRPGGPPLRFLYPLYILYPLFICALRRINLPGAGVCPCRPTHCGPRPGAFPGRWLFSPGRSRCGVRPGSPGPGL